MAFKEGLKETEKENIWMVVEKIRKEVWKKKEDIETMQIGDGSSTEEPKIVKLL